MYTLSKTFGFEASHVLPDHDGKCARLHGHSWGVEIEVCGATLEQAGPRRGMVMDYAQISQAMRPLLDDYLDHHHLNTTLEALANNPTSERVAHWIYHQLALTLPGLHAVTVRETCTSSCRYQPLEAPPHV